MKTPYPLQWLAGILSCWYTFGSRPSVPKDKSTVALTSFHGDGYRGNTRILFERMCDHPSLKPVWLSRNHKIVQKLKVQFGDERACLTHSLAGIKILNQASAVFLTHGTSDYPFMRLPRHALIIQAYHGLPTKGGEYMRPGNNKRPGFFHRKILEYRFRPITHFLSSSPLVTGLFSTRFNIPPDRFLETGYPAYDALASYGASAHSSSHPSSLSKPSAQNISKTASNRLSMFWPEAPEAEKLILYAPTFRRRSRTRWFPFDDFDPDTLAAFLEKNKALMALRAHPNEGVNIRRFRSISPRIVSGDHKTVEDVFELLSVSDVIMTDYSSIYLEGLLLDIPVVFLPYDLKTYERGLSMPFEQMSPGPSVHSQKRLLESLDKAIQQDDGYELHRKKVRGLYFSCVDGKSTDRVIQFLESSLNC